MNGVQVTRIAWSGLKQDDGEIVLGPATVVVGENGAGKTTIIDALHLLVFGRGSSPDLPKTADGVMRLARGDEIVIDGSIRLEDGRTAKVRRKWKQKVSKGGKVSVKEEIDLSGFPPTRDGVEEKKGLVRGLLGSCLDAWTPAEILTLSAGKLRKRLLELIPRQDRTLDRWVPKDCPGFAKPDAGDEEVLDWAHMAIRRTRRELETEYARRRELQAVLEEVEDAWEDLGSIAPLQKRLASLRAELVDAERAGQAERKMVVQRSRLSQISAEVARLAEDYDAPEWATNLIGPIVMETERLIDEEVRPRLEQLHADKQRLQAMEERIENLKKHAAGAVASDDALAAIHKLIDETGDMVDQLEDDRRALGAKIEVLEKDPPIVACPKCQFAFGAYWAQEKEKLLAEAGDVIEKISAAKADLASLNSQANQIEAALEAAQDAARATDLRKQVEATTEAYAQAYGEGFRHLGIDAVESERRRVDWFRRHGELRELRAQRDDLESDLEIEEAQLQETYGAARPFAVIEAEAGEIERKIEELGRENERKTQHQEASVELKQVEEHIERLLVWEKRFVSIETELLDQARGWLEEKLSAHLSEAVRVELRDARGNDTCRISVAGVDALTLAAGERFALIASLIGAIAAAQPDAKWRPAVLDGFEVVSSTNRERFLETLLAQVEAGVLSQAVISGCPDSVPDVEGVRVVRVAHQRSEAAA